MTFDDYVTIAIFGLAGVAAWFYLKVYTRKVKRVIDPMMRFLIVFIVTMTVATTASVVFSSVRSRQAADCQAKINLAVIETLKTRSEPSSEADTALLGLAQAILDAKTIEDTKAAARRFIDALTAKRSTQQKNPLPDVPPNCRP